MRPANEGLALSRATPADGPDLGEFLRAADLTGSGLDSPTVRLWILRDGSGRIVGSTGFEISDDAKHVLLRSVAVDSSARGVGTGTVLAEQALAHAEEAGATRAWLFSRRSGPFWQGLGFEPADREELAAALPSTHQVRLFRQTGQLNVEVAWSRALAPSLDS